jgi:hypothetical protein
MNLEAFKQAYLNTISESADDSDLKNYIRSIVEKVVSESKLQESNLLKGKLVSDNELRAAEHFEMGIMALLGKSKFSDLSTMERETIDELVPEMISDLKNLWSGN